MNEFQPKNVLVTGGAGFIGANFIHYILGQYPDAKVVNLDLLTYAGSEQNLAGADPERHHFVQGDIGDQPLVEGLFREHHIDTLVHFAAESHVDRSISSPVTFIETNLVGTFILLEAARKIWLGEQGLDESACRFHHVSTDEVYGSLGIDDPAFVETTAYDPSSPYSASKAGSDHLVTAYCRTYGLPVTISNCSNNYGPYQHPEKLIPTVIRCCLEGQQIPVYGDGSNIRDWLYVEDHCVAIDRVLRTGRKGETYNVGGKEEHNNMDIVRRICALLDERRPQGAPHADLISFVDDRLGHDWRYAIDNSKIQKELAWEPAENFDSGLAKTVDWYLENGFRGISG